MKKLSEINESLWMDSIKRANSNIVRKEDKIRYIDLGLNVLWGTDDIKINNQDDFYFDEIEKNIEDGCRLPTRSEAEDFISSAKFNYDDGYIYATTEYDSIKFNYDGSEFMIKYWVSNDIPNDTNKLSFTMKMLKGGYIIKSYNSIRRDDDVCKLRLVKDKK